MDQIFTSPNAFDFDNLRRDRAALDRDSLGEDLVTGAVSQGNGTVGVGRGWSRTRSDTDRSVADFDTYTEVPAAISTVQVTVVSLV